MRSRDRVVIGWLDPGMVHAEFMCSVARIYAERSNIVDGLLRVNPGGLLSKGRNELTRAFLNSDAQWLLMLDSDEDIPLDAFDKLVGAVHDTQRPVVAGLYFGAWPGEPYPLPVPLIFRDAANGEVGRFDAFHGYPRNTVCEIASAGTGCMMIHRSVFETIRDKSNDPDWCWFWDGPLNGQWISEDHYFCQLVRENGFKIHAHTGAVLGHRKSFIMSERQHDVLRLAQEAKGLL